jgi:hypothetical protein
MAAQGRIVALLEDAAAKVTPFRNTKTVGFALAPSVE